MPAPNPHEDLARTRKARAIADTIWASVAKSANSDEELAASIEEVISCAPHWRDSFARCAGHREPSEETWAEVARRLRTLMGIRRTIRRLHETAHA